MEEQPNKSWTNLSIKVKKEDRDLLEKRQYIKCYKRQTEESQKDTNRMKEDLEKMKNQNSELQKNLKIMEQSYERDLKNQSFQRKLLERSKIKLESEEKTWAERIKCSQDVLDTQMRNFRKIEIIHQNTVPEYNEYKKELAAKNLLEFKKKMLRHQVEEEKSKFQLKKNIRQKIFNNKIIKFVKRVKAYKESAALKAKIDLMTQNGNLLLQKYTEKLVQLENEKLSIQASENLKEIVKARGIPKKEFQKPRLPPSPTPSINCSMIIKSKHALSFEQSEQMKERANKRQKLFHKISSKVKRTETITKDSSTAINTQTKLPNSTLSKVNPIHINQQTDATVDTESRFFGKMKTTNTIIATKLAPTSTSNQSKPSTIPELSKTCAVQIDNKAEAQLFNRPLQKEKDSLKKILEQKKVLLSKVGSKKIKSSQNKKSSQETISSQKQNLKDNLSLQNTNSSQEKIISQQENFKQNMNSPQNKSSQEDVKSQLPKLKQKKSLQDKSSSQEKRNSQQDKINSQFMTGSQQSMSSQEMTRSQNTVNSQEISQRNTSQSMTKSEHSVESVPSQKQCDVKILEQVIVKRKHMNRKMEMPTQLNFGPRPNIQKTIISKENPKKIPKSDLRSPFFSNDDVNSPKKGLHNQEEDGVFKVPALINEEHFHYDQQLSFNHGNEEGNISFGDALMESDMEPSEPNESGTLFGTGKGFQLFFK